MYLVGRPSSLFIDKIIKLGATIETPNKKVAEVAGQLQKHMLIFYTFKTLTWKYRYNLKVIMPSK